MLIATGKSALAKEKDTELRIGAFSELYHKSSYKKMRIEKISTLNIQYLFPNLMDDNSAIFKDLRPHIGSMLNLNGGTSQYYAGLTWNIPINNYFVELSFGGEIHNGPLKKPTTKKPRPLGSRLLFRESIAFGVNLKENATLSFVIDHASNAHLANPNSGLTDIGLQLGYKF